MGEKATRMEVHPNGHKRQSKRERVKWLSVHVESMGMGKEREVLAKQKRKIRWEKERKEGEGKRKGFVSVRKKGKEVQREVEWIHVKSPSILL